MVNSGASIVGYQSWKNLTFLHWQVEPQEVQKLLPPHLTVETFDGAAWVGLVPFSMERVRPWWSPAVPGISWFLETNVRTYVRHDSGVSAVWFFSLDANHRLAVSVARRFWHLPYVYARMSLQQQKQQSQHRLIYEGHRRDASAAGYRIEVNDPSSMPLQSATPGTLEHFLLERYTLLARRPNATYFSGQVYHEPYQYRLITQSSVSQTLLSAAGLTTPDVNPPVHIAFSPGVDVRIGALQAVVS